MVDSLKYIDMSVLEGFFNGILPDPLMTVSEWADLKRILAETSAEPGRFKTERTPYLKEIMDKLSVTDPAQKIVVKKGAQLGFTEAGNNWVGYCIDIAPAPFIFIMPTDTAMKNESKRRIEKMIDSTPELKVKVPKARGKDGGNTLLYKEYPGGFVTMVGANSPVGLASTPAKNIYADEIDRYPASVGEEGSAVDLADTRTSTFGNRRKIFLTSTPTIEGASQIDAEFQGTGQRYYHVPCPFCQEFQVLSFDQVRYTVGNYKDVRYECFNCHELIEEYHKTYMLKHGKWIAKFPEKEDGYTFGYHISAIYSPYGMYSWSKMAREHDKAQGNIPKLIVFTNTKLGETYSEVKGDKPDWEALSDRSEEYKENSPFASVVFITAGVDIQKDRIEVEVVGWMKGMTSQSIDYRVLIGDTQNDEVWSELAKMLNETWVRQGDNALLPLRQMAIDAGYMPEKVYAFTQKYSVGKVIPIKGVESLKKYATRPQQVYVSKAGKTVGKVKVWPVGVSVIKGEVYGFLKLKINRETGEIPNGYCHFPKRDDNYFRGLTAEEYVMVTNKKNYDAFEWRLKYKRNEPLDTRVYARAAAFVVGMDRWSDDRWKQEATGYETQKRQAAPQPQQQSKNKPFDPFWGDFQIR